MIGLYFIVLIQVTGMDKVVLLETYPSMDACEQERMRVYGEMDKIYPNDTSWKLSCKPIGKGA